MGRHRSGPESQLKASQGVFEQSDHAGTLPGLYTDKAVQVDEGNKLMAKFELAYADYGIRLFVLPPALQNSMGALKDPKYVFRRILRCVCSGKRLEVFEQELEKLGMGL